MIAMKILALIGATLTGASFFVLLSGGWPRWGRYVASWVTKPGR